jgi:S-adenosylmethionine:tRNA ribosyltransferase-isomerase
VKLSDFDYELPQDRIAQWPLEERDASRMLLLNRLTGDMEDREFRELPEVIRGDELIVLNNTRVLPVRLLGFRAGVRSERPGKAGAARREFLKAPIEVLLIREREPLVWEALVRPGRKVRIGEKILFGDGELAAEVEGRGEYGLRRLRFSASENFHDLLERLGHIPLPPYIKRPDAPLDRERYQTIYARCNGAAAAPTAGLHFTSAILDRLRASGAEICEITLRVGLGTFEPIRSERLEDHRMHAEPYEIDPATAAAIERARAERRPILAVGTTVVRALEDAATRCAARKRAGQAASPLIAPGPAEAEIFLYPGKEFRVVDQLLTNFHLPRSSLLALVAAFAGRERTLHAYRHAIEKRYRFYSYGDCMLVRGASAAKPADAG